MKKNIVALLVLTAIAGCFIGCSKDESSTNTSILNRGGGTISGTITGLGAPIDSSRDQAALYLDNGIRCRIGTYTTVYKQKCNTATNCSTSGSSGSSCSTCQNPNNSCSSSGTSSGCNGGNSGCPICSSCNISTNNSSTNSSSNSLYSCSTSTNCSTGESGSNVCTITTNNCGYFYLVNYSELKNKVSEGEYAEVVYDWSDKNVTCRATLIKVYSANSINNPYANRVSISTNGN